MHPPVFNLPLHDTPAYNQLHEIGNPLSIPIATINLCNPASLLIPIPPSVLSQLKNFDPHNPFLFCNNALPTIHTPTHLCIQPLPTINPYALSTASNNNPPNPVVSLTLYDLSPSSNSPHTGPTLYASTFSRYNPHMPDPEDFATEVDSEPISLLCILQTFQRLYNNQTSYHALQQALQGYSRDYPIQPLPPLPPLLDPSSFAAHTLIDLSILPIAALTTTAEPLTVRIIQPLIRSLSSFAYPNAGSCSFSLVIPGNGLVPPDSKLAFISLLNAAISRYISPHMAAALTC